MDAPSLLVRPAGPADIPTITAIYSEQVRFGTATFELDPPSEAEMQRRFETILGAGYPYFVAERGGAVLGYAYAGVYRPRPAYRFTVEDSVYIAEEARGTGVGTALMRTLVAETEARGFRQMIAVIGDSANQASIRLHARAGFIMVGNFAAVGWKFGRWLDSVLMQRALGPGAGSPAEG
jgi:phosphinothricin acetyltransferase